LPLLIGVNGQASGPSAAGTLFVLFTVSAAAFFRKEKFIAGAGDDRRIQPLKTMKSLLPLIG
jgi:hypothetical protein